MTDKQERSPNAAIRDYADTINRLLGVKVIGPGWFMHGHAPNGEQVYIGMMTTHTYDDRGQIVDTRHEPTGVVAVLR